MSRNLAHVRDMDFGMMGNPPAESAFDPLTYCACPGRWRAIDRRARRRVRRAMARGGIGTKGGESHADHSGRLTREGRESIVERAVETFWDFFLSRDYGAAGIGCDSPAVAVASTLAWLDRARWRDPSNPRPSNAAAPYPYRASAVPSPDAVAVAAESVGVDPATAAAALVGQGTNEGTARRAVAVPGGPSGRGATDGRIEWHEVVTRSWVERGDDGTLYQCDEREGRWRMKRGRGMKRTLPPALVIDAPPADAPRYAGPARPPVPVAGERAGERCAVLHHAPDVDAYRAALAAYYAGE